MYSEVEPLSNEEQQSLAMDIYEHYDDVKRIVIQINTCFDVVYKFLDGLTFEKKCDALFGDGTPNPDGLTNKQRLDSLMIKFENCLDDAVHWSDVWVTLTDLHLSAALRDACTHNLLEQSNEITEIDRAVNILLKTRCNQDEVPLIRKALRKNRAAGRWIAFIADKKTQSEAKRLLKRYAIIRAKNVKDCEALLDLAGEVQKKISKATEIGHKLCVTNVKLAMKQTSRKNPNPDEFHDYVHEGMLGMFRASELYNPYSTASFSTYAYYYLCDAINRYHSNTASLINHPMKLKRDIAKMNEHADEFKHDSKSNSKIEHLKVSLGKSSSEINNLMSYDTHVFTDDFDTLNNQEDDYNALPDEFYARNFNQRKLKQVYNKLSDREKIVFDCRISGKLREPISLRQFNKKTNIPFSGEYIRLVEKDIMSKIQNAIEGD